MFDTEVMAKNQDRAEIQEAVRRFLDAGGQIDVATPKVYVPEITGNLNEKVKRPRYTAEDEANIRRLHANGATISQIAKEIGRLRQSVSTKMRQMGLMVIQASETGQYQARQR